MSSPNYEYLENPGVRVRNGKPSDIGHLEEEERRYQADLEDSLIEKHSNVIEPMWYGGHVTVAVSGFLGILACLTRQVWRKWPHIVYRFSFVSILFTYGLSLLQNLNGATPGFYALLPLATFQFLILASIWLFTIPHAIKLIPFAMCSLLHVIDTENAHHLPKSSSRHRIAHDMTEEVAPRVIKSLPYLDMWLFLELFMDCILIRPGAVVSLSVFLFFFRVKLMYSANFYGAFMNVYNRADNYLADPKTPKGVREFWIRFRNKIVASQSKSSQLYKDDTERAIEMANLYSSLDTC